MTTPRPSWLTVTGLPPSLYCPRDTEPGSRKELTPGVKVTVPLLLTDVLPKTRLPVLASVSPAVNVRAPNVVLPAPALTVEVVPLAPPTITLLPSETAAGAVELKLKLLTFCWE